MLPNANRLDLFSEEAPCGSILVRLALGNIG